MKCPSCQRDHDDFVSEAFPGRDIMEEFDQVWQESEVMTQEQAREYCNLIFGNLIHGKANPKEQLAAARFVVASISSATGAPARHVLNSIAHDYLMMRARAN
jgi:hypothetical protein